MSLEDIKQLRSQFLDVIDGAISNLENGVEVDLSSTGIKFQKDISNYPYNMQSVIKNYIKSTSKKIVGFVSNYKKTSNFARLNLVPATNNQVKDLKILVGIDVTGFVNAVNTNALDHIEKRHGANGEADKSMANIEDIARMEYVIKNYDNIELLKNSNDEVKYSKEFSDKNNKPAPLVKYSKKINGTYYLIEAVVDSKFKKLWVVSAYINKNDTVTQTLNGENAPETYAHGELASPVSTNSISQNTEKSNIKKSLDVDSEGTKLSDEQIKRYKNVAPELRDEQGRIKPFYHGTSKADVVMRSGEVAHPI